MVQEKQKEKRKKTLGAVGEWIATFPRRGIEIAASLVVILATAAAVVLALHIVFVVVKTNQDNGIVQFVDDVAGTLAWQFKGLFLAGGKNMQVFVNFGLAAIVYLVLGRLASGLLRRLG